MKEKIKMKKIKMLFLFSLCLFGFYMSVIPQSGSNSNIDQDARMKKWQEDIDYLVTHLEVLHPNLYANITKDSFYYYTDQLKRNIATSTDVGMIFGIQELIARIGNTHTLCNVLRYMNFSETLKKQFNYYPIYYNLFKDGLYVIAAPEKYKNILGKKVMNIGNLKTEKAFSELARFVAADNYMTPKANIPRFFLNDGQLLRHIGASNSPDNISLTLENEDGSIFKSEIETMPDSDISNTQIHSLRAMSKNPNPLYLKKSDNYWFEFMPETEAIYLQINLMNHKEPEKFGEFCNRLFDTLDIKHAKKLIIDVRLCPGGDHIELPLLKGILARPHLDKSDCLFLIVGRITGSAAEHLTSVLQKYTNATLFGEPTSSKPNQYGAMQQFVLPNSRLEISCATKHFIEDPSNYFMTSEPDFFVERTFDDYKNNLDPVMGKIMNYDSYKDLRTEFFKSMSEAYKAGGIINFKSVFNTLNEKYKPYGFNMEVLLYKDLDSWIGNNSKNENDYIEFLKFIHAELPNSIQINYDLAYWMNKIGEKAEAKRLYKKCIQLNPEHHHAKMRLRLMEIDRF